VQYAHPNAKDILCLAVNAFEQGQGISILDAQPVYLRDSVSWKKRERIRTQSL
jgi:tRNA threonylcarbamoyladenosine biosynthesis protein TsaB